VALVTAVALATFTGAALLWRFRGSVILFLVSLVIAASLRPFVEELERRRLNRGLALAIVYGTGLALFALFLYLVFHRVLDEVEKGAELLAQGWDRLRTQADPVSPLHVFLIERLPPAEAIYRAIGAADAGALARQLLGFTLNIIDIVGRCLIVIALSAYWSASHESFERLWMSLVPAARRTRARDIWRAMEAGVGGHLRTEIGQSLLAVLLLGVAFHLARLPIPMLPALAAGLFRLVPFVGILIAVAVSFVAGAVVSSWVGLAAGLYTLAVLFTLDRWVAGRLFRARRYSPTLIVFLVVALVDYRGMVGLVVASPLAVAIQIFIERLIATQPRRIRRAETLLELEARLAAVRQRMLLVRPEEASELSSVFERLGYLLAEAKRVAAGSLPAASVYSVEAPVARASAEAAMLRSKTDWR
jgi:predicted PurR-regulated permease PerM